MLGFTPAFLVSNGIEMAKAGMLVSLTSWVSIGSMGALLMGTSLYGERLNRNQLLSLSLLIIGCIGLFIGGQ